MTYMIEEAARGLARLELFRKLRREPTISEVERAYEEHGRVYRTDARAALLEALCVNDDEAVDAIARAIAHTEWSGEDPLPPVSAAAERWISEHLDGFKFKARAAIKALRVLCTPSPSAPPPVRGDE